MYGVTQCIKGHRLWHLKATVTDKTYESNLLSEVIERKLQHSLDIIIIISKFIKCHVCLKKAAEKHADWWTVERTNCWLLVWWTKT